MKKSLQAAFFLITLNLMAQVNVILPTNPDENTTELNYEDDELKIRWPAGMSTIAMLNIDLKGTNPLFKRISLENQQKEKEIAAGIDPVFMINVGKRTLKPENGWTIFFDKVPERPYTSAVLKLDKSNVQIEKKGTRTTITISTLRAPDFEGNLQLTFYEGAPLFNIAAVITTQKDSTALLYDAGLVGNNPWQKVSFADVEDNFVEINTSAEDTATHAAVKYRTLVGSNSSGALAVFPPPHQYFYPLDEAFNLKFNWYGTTYRNLSKVYGIGIRQDPEGDHRYVPWFNAPPNTQQRLNFFCLLGNAGPERLLEDVKKYTHDDRYVPLKNHKTMASHFHNEFIMNEVLAGKEIPGKPEFVDVFKNMGVNIVHLGEFHYTAHPKGPDSLRLNELHALFEECERLSDDSFLLLPGEEPNEFLGGHWMAFFPKPVYWIMARKADQPFVTQDTDYGKVYRIRDKTEMLRLLQLENGLAWTAHPRIKGSTGYPDAYKDEIFFKSERFLGAAWKAMPADLSIPKLGTRVLNLMDDMNNWGFKKKVLAEADLFTVTHKNEMYAHMNINYVKLNTLPHFSEGWQSVLKAVENGKFFSTTGEILIPNFTINGKEAGETIILGEDKKTEMTLEIDWTFPLNFIEIISGDGKDIFREKIELSQTKSFGKKTFKLSPKLTGRKWVRAEIWDCAANGAFTQTIYIKE